jgi:hypothetical protein
VTLSVGFGSGVITPDLPVVLAGFGARKGPATGIRDDLTAQAVVLRNGRDTACLLVLDLLMLGSDVAPLVRRAVAEALGTTPEHVMTSCTHTHSGPAATSSVRRIGWPMPDAYVGRLVEGSVAAARAALAGAEPAQLSYARAPLPADLSTNRRGLPYDPSYSVLDVRRRDGTRLGSIAGVGIHPVALGVTCTEVSGDWVATYRSAMTASTGAPAVLLSGALGDVNPTRDPHTDPDSGGNWETARLLGTEIASCAGDLLAQATALPDELELLPRRVVGLRAGLTVPALLNKVALRTVGLELQEWSLGGVRLVSVPGEVFHELGRAIERSRGDKALLAGLAPEYHGYLPAPFRSGYEEKMSYGRRFVGRVADALLDVPS